MTPSEFKAWFPAPSPFAAMTDQAIQPYLTRTTPYFDVGRWGEFYSEGVANLAAHFIVAANAAASAGITSADAGDIVSENVGPVSFSKSGELVAEEARDPLMRTSYGQEYCRLRNLIGLGGATSRR